MIKLNRRQLRRLILKEFKDTSRDTSLFDDIITGGGNLPPSDPPGEPGGGGGRRPTPCESDKDGIYDTAYGYVLDAMGTYLKHVVGMDEFEYIEKLLGEDKITLKHISDYGGPVNLITDGIIANTAMA